MVLEVAAAPIAWDKTFGEGVGNRGMAYP